jgi:hypothetical protein
MPIEAHKAKEFSAARLVSITTGIAHRSTTAKASELGFNMLHAELPDMWPTQNNNPSQQIALAPENKITAMARSPTQAPKAIAITLAAI